MSEVTPGPPNRRLTTSVVSSPWTFCMHHSEPLLQVHHPVASVK